MAVRQYVGARYVPKFFENSLGTSEWQANTAYEPLTIVTYNSNSYTSKKDVPAGIGNPSANPEYWVSTGVYNQQVEEYRQEVEELAQSAEKKQLANARIICVGDSYAEGYNPDTGTVVSNGWPAQLKAALGLSDNDFFFTYAGGCGFSSERAGGGFSAILENYKDSVTDPDTIDYVICMGGHNDRNSTIDLVYAGIQNFYNTAHSAFPNAKIFIGMCAWDGAYDMQNQINEVLIRYLYGIRNYAPKIIYLNGIENILLNIGLLSSDKKHPTALGNKYLADGVIQAINGFCTVDYAADGLTLTPLSGVSFDNTPGMSARIYNGIVKFVMNRLTVDFDSNQTINGHGGRIVIADAVNFPRSADASSVSSWYACTVMIRDVSDSSNIIFRYVPADVGFFNGQLCCVFYRLNSTGKNWENWIINRIEIPQLTLIISAHA